MFHKNKRFIKKEPFIRYFLYIRIVIKTTHEYDKKIISHRYTDFLGNPHVRLANLISSVYNKTGKQVVVLIDEYDAPLLDVAHQDERLMDVPT